MNANIVSSLLIHKFSSLLKIFFRGERIRCGGSALRLYKEPARRPHLHIAPLLSVLCFNLPTKQTGRRLDGSSGMVVEPEFDGTLFIIISPPPTLFLPSAVMRPPRPGQSAPSSPEAGRSLRRGNSRCSSIMSTTRSSAVEIECWQLTARLFLSFSAHSIGAEVETEVHPSQHLVVESVFLCRNVGGGHCFASHRSPSTAPQNKHRQLRRHINPLRHFPHFEYKKKEVLMVLKPPSAGEGSPLFSFFFPSSITWPTCTPG